MARAGETFTVWFRTLNRLAAIGVVPAARTADEGDRRPSPDAVDGDPSLERRRRSRPGSSAAPGRRPGRAVCALGTGSIIFDGLSQTVAFASVFGAPALRPKTLLLLVFLGLVVAAPRSRSGGW